MITSGSDFKKWAEVFGIKSGGGGGGGSYQPNGSSVTIAFVDGDPDAYIPLPIPSIMSVTNAPLDNSGNLFIPPVDPSVFEMPIKGQLSFYVFNNSNANFTIQAPAGTVPCVMVPGSVVQLLLLADNVLADPQWIILPLMTGLLNGKDFADLTTTMGNLQITGLQDLPMFDWYAPGANGAQLGQTTFTNYVAQTRQFLQGVSNILYAQGSLPARYVHSGAFNLYLPYFITTTSTTNFTIKSSSAWVVQGGSMDVTLSSVTTNTVTPSGTANQRGVIDITLTPSGTWTPNAQLVIKLERDGTDSLATTVNTLPGLVAFTSITGNDG